MKKIILFILLGCLFESCKIQKKFSSSEEINESINSELTVLSTTRNLQVPGVNLLLGQKLLISSDGKIDPISRSIQDSASGKTLTVKVDEYGEMFISSTSPPDTLTETYNTQNLKLSIDRVEKREEKTKIKKSNSGFLFGVLLAFVLVILFILYIKQ